MPELSASKSQMLQLKVMGLLEIPGKLMAPSMRINVDLYLRYNLSGDDVFSKITRYRSTVLRAFIDVTTSERPPVS